MRELSLHVLDLIENSIRVEATVIAVTVCANAEQDLLCVKIEDNGPGLSVSPEDALNPFYTTKAGKRTGLGLSLFRAAAEQAGGTLSIRKSDLGGVGVTAEMKLSHVDRHPLGNLAGTLSTVVMTSPQIDFRIRLQLGARDFNLRTGELSEAVGGNGLRLARQVKDRIEAELQEARNAAGLLL